MHLLFVHQNFPGQFRHLAPAMARRGHTVDALAITPRAKLPGVRLSRYAPKRATTRSIHPLAAEFETKMIRGAACAQAMLALREAGVMPDVVVAHPGWGEASFVKDVWPAAKLLCFIEYHYLAEGGDSGFDPEFVPASAVETRMKLRAKNANNLIALDAMDRGYAPTRWQASTIPAAYRDRVDVIFDGIDTRVVRPDAQASFTVGAGTPRERTLRPGDEVITFVNRNLEPYRGYHVFMRALPRILRERPGAVALIVGEDGVSYGASAPQGTTWKQVFLDEVRDRLDMDRVFFLGRLPYGDYLRLLQVSACHVYLTYPFVLSWSCIEAMGAGCVVVGSDTAPVREVIEHGRNGLLVDFFERDRLAATVCDVLAHPARHTELRAAARGTVVERYDLESVCLPRQVALVESLGPPAPSAGGSLLAASGMPAAGAAEALGKAR